MHLGKLNVVRLLIKRGSNITSIDKEFKTALRVAMDNGNNLLSYQYRSIPLR